jgi:NAD(P)-dependent dehydrogenase (short-subunit alcohol dehydrogenase family)
VGGGLWPAISGISVLWARVSGAGLCLQQLLPILHEGSSIVLLSSLAARAAVGALSAYAATKSAVDTLVKHFAFVLGCRGLRVNAVAPGVVQTDMSNFTKSDAGRDYTLGMQALKRLAEPDDIGGVVAFLASGRLDRRACRAERRAARAGNCRANRPRLAGGHGPLRFWPAMYCTA